MALREADFQRVSIQQKQASQAALVRHAQCCPSTAWGPKTSPLVREDDELLEESEQLVQSPRLCHRILAKTPSTNTATDSTNSNPTSANATNSASTHPPHAPPQPGEPPHPARLNRPVRRTPP